MFYKLKKTMQRSHDSVKCEKIFSALPLNFKHENGANFCFQKRFERVEWKKLASVDITKVCQEIDIQTLQENVNNITFCNIESELDKPVDSNFVKLFKLAQLIIEYLLYSQEYLIGVVSTLEERLHEVNHELSYLKKERSKEQYFANNLEKTNKRNKKILVKQHNLFSGMIGSSVRCPYCPKAFINPSFLKCHMTKKHHYETTCPSTGSNLMIYDNKVEVASPYNTIEIESLRKELAEVKENLKYSVHTTKEKSNQNDKAENMETVQKEIQTWKTDAEKQKEDLISMQELFLMEIKGLHEKLQNYDETISALMQAYNLHRKSNFGSLIDENCTENSNKILLQEKEDINKLKDELLAEITIMKKMLQDEVMKKEVHWKDKLNELTIQHSDEMEKISCPETSPLKMGSSVSLINSYLEEKEEQVHQNQCHSSLALINMKDVLSANKDWKTSERVTTALKSSPCLLSGLHKELSRLVEDKLQKYGIKSSAASVTTELACMLMNHLRDERTNLSKQYQNYYEIRQNYATFIDNLSQKKLLESSQTEPFVIVCRSTRNLGKKTVMQKMVGRSHRKAFIDFAIPSMKRVIINTTSSRVTSPNDEVNSTGGISLEHFAKKMDLRLLRKQNQEVKKKLSNVSTSVWDTESCKSDGHLICSESQSSFESVSSWNSEQDFNTEDK